MLLKIFCSNVATKCNGGGLATKGCKCRQLCYQELNADITTVWVTQFHSKTRNILTKHSVDWITSCQFLKQKIWSKWFIDYNFEAKDTIIVINYTLNFKNNSNETKSRILYNMFLPNFQHLLPKRIILIDNFQRLLKLLQ